MPSDECTERALKMARVILEKGKGKGKSLEEVRANHPDYVGWLLANNWHKTNLDFRSDHMIFFTSYPLHI